MDKKNTKSKSGGKASTKRTDPARKKNSAKNMMDAVRRNSVYQRLQSTKDAEKRQVEELCFQRTYIDKKLLAKEAKLLTRRWVGNRYMTPLQATQAFTNAYVGAYRAAWARHYDATEASKKQPCASSFALNDRENMSSLWMARQKADELGMPYELYCEIVIEQWISGRKAENLPLPNQMYTGKLLNGWMRGRPTWDEAGDRLYLSDWDQRFLMEPIGDDPVHAAALRALHADVLHAADKPERLARYLRSGGPLTMARAVTMFDPSWVHDAMTLVAKPTQPADAPNSYVPACIGNRSQDEDAPCHTCPFATQCSALKKKATRALNASGSSGDPRADRRREQNRESQRRHREKQRHNAFAKPGAARNSGDPRPPLSAAP